MKSELNVLALEERSVGDRGSAWELIVDKICQEGMFSIESAERRGLLCTGTDTSV